MYSVEVGRIVTPAWSSEYDDSDNSQFLAFARRTSRDSGPSKHRHPSTDKAKGDDQLVKRVLVLAGFCMGFLR